jgi:surfeit locus 1 family protein
MTSAPRRFPIGLTIAAAVVVAICAGLGVWQMQRLHWKDAMLAKLAVLQHAAAQPIAPVLARAARGEDVEFTRVTADCAPAAPASVVFVQSVIDGQWVWRPQSACALAAPPYDGVIVDRGVVDATRGQTSASALALPAPGRLVGVLRKPPKLPSVAGLAHPAPYVLVADSETPAARGVTASPLPNDAPDNLQYVGAYGPTWFGLAGVAACFYAAMLWRRYRPKT